MDFDYTLTKIQGSLLCIAKLLGIKLTDINRDTHEEIEKALKIFESTLDDLKKTQDNLRKINIFLIINTEFSSIQLLGNDVNLCHLVNIIPQMSTYFYFQLLVNTDIYKTVGDIIISCPEALVIDIMKTISINLKLVKCDKIMDFLFLMYDHLYQKLIYLEKENKISNIKETFTKVLQSVIDFQINELEDCIDWKKERKYIFFGHYVKMFLNLVEMCISRFKSREVNQINEMYMMKIDYNYQLWPLQIKDRDWLTYSLNVIVAKCKKIVREVTVDIYMSWCEEEFDAEGKTLQAVVRETAYTCKEALLSISDYEESVMDISILINTLNNFALKPQNEDDEIRNADINLIISSMQNPEKSQLKWLKAFLHIDNVLLNDSCLSVLEGMASIFDVGATTDLLQLVTNHLKRGDISVESVSPLKQILFKCVKQLKFEEQLKLIEDFHISYLGSDILKSPNFQQSLTETFNKIVNEVGKIEELYPELMVLILQSVREVIPQIMDDCLKSSSMCNLFVTILSKIELLSKISVSSSDSTPLCFSILVKKFDDYVKSDADDTDNLIYMIKMFSSCNIIDGKLFLLRYLIPGIQTSLSCKKWKDLKLSLYVLGVFVDKSTGDHVTDNLAEILAFLVQVLDRSRLQPGQFNQDSALVCEEVSHFISSLTNMFLEKKKNAFDNEVIWLREVGSSCGPLSWFHMRKLWQGSRLPADPKDLLAWSLQDLGRQDLFDMAPHKRASFVTGLCKVLPLLTMQEWKMIGYDISGMKKAETAVAVYHIVADCMLVLTQLPVILSNSFSLANLLTNFIAFTKFKIVGTLKFCNRQTSLSVFRKHVLVVSEIPEEVVKTRVAALIPLFQEMVDEISDKTEAGQSQSDLILSLAPIREPTLQIAISQNIINKLTA